MKVIAKLNYLHISPRKVRAVVNVVKKMTPEGAIAQLKFIPNRASEPLGKLLKSAMANAENNFSLDAQDLKISEFKVDGGPVFKRFRPSSRGRVAPIAKRTSHVTLVLEGERTAVKKAKSDVSLNRKDSTSETEKTDSVTESKKTDTFKPRVSNKKGSGGFVKKIFQRKTV